MQSAEGEEDHEHTDSETEVSEPVYDERLLAGVSGRLLVEVISDQEVRAETDTLPAEIQLEEVVPHNEHQHTEGKKIQIREKPVIAGIPVHIPYRIDMDKSRACGYYHEHDYGKGVDQETDGSLEASGNDPGIEVCIDHMPCEHIPESKERAYPGTCNCKNSRPVGIEFSHFLAEKDIDEKSYQRQKRY
jgi:hypothetical protein